MDEIGNHVVARRVAQESSVAMQLPWARMNCHTDPY